MRIGTQGRRRHVWGMTSRRCVDCDTPSSEAGIECIAGECSHEITQTVRAGANKQIERCTMCHSVRVLGLYEASAWMADSDDERVAP